MREDWVECKFDNIISSNGIFVDGDWIEKKDQDQKGQIRLIQLSDIGDGYFRNRSNIFINEETSEKLKVTFIRKDDILIARMPEPLGRATIFPYDGKFITAVDVAIVRLGHTMIENKYILYLINSPLIRNEISKLESGTTRKRISRKNLSTIRFPIAPLPEQRAIVKKIEALFSSLDAGISDLKKAQDQLKIYRQAVLKKAFEGESEIKLLKDIAEVKRGKSKHRPRNDKKLFGGPYPFIQTGEVRKANGGIIKSFENTYSEFGLQQSKLWPKGTLCLTIAANIGETAFLGFDACFPDSIVGIKADESILNINYFNYFIQLTKSELDRKASATAQKNINVEFLEALEIPIYSLDEQAQIVKEIEARLSVCDAVEQQIKDSLSQAEALRQSILKKAFEGKLLTEEEVKACQQAPDYEPASVLLEKIKAEKVASRASATEKPVKKSKKK